MYMLYQCKTAIYFQTSCKVEVNECQNGGTMIWNPVKSFTCQCKEGLKGNYVKMVICSLIMRQTLSPTHVCCVHFQHTHTYSECHHKMIAHQTPAGNLNVTYYFVFTSFIYEMQWRNTTPGVASKISKGHPYTNYILKDRASVMLPKNKLFQCGFAKVHRIYTGQE